MTTFSPTSALTHPTNSSRLLYELLALTETGQLRNKNGIDVASVIALPQLKRFISAITFRDGKTMFHSRRTGLIAQGIARRLGWEERHLRVIEIASLLHDLGKVAVPDHILQKPGKLAPDESEYIATQHRVVLGILQACQVDPEVIEIIAQSHGLLTKDGQGASMGARILTVADAFDSLTHSQPFRQAYSRSDAFKILEEQCGKHFDRNVVGALQRWLDSTDSNVLDEDQAIAEAIQARTAEDPETTRDGNLFWNLCSYLYLLETMYDAYYIVDAQSNISVWSAGAAKLFGPTTKSMQGKRWGRTPLFDVNSVVGADPLQTAFRTKRSFCSRMTTHDAAQTSHQLDVQTIPILDPLGEVKGVIELICNDSQAKQARGQFRQLQHEATRDALTGVLNRGKLEKEAKALFEEHQQSGHPLSFIYLDLDHFKAINDRLSHVVGDQVLIDVARLVEDNLYSGEILGRYGGEEFVIICPETDLAHAIERAERLRRLISEAEIAGRADLRVTASFGVAELEQGDTLEATRKRADEALYDSKRAGRNRTSHRQKLAKPVPDLRQVAGPKQIANNHVVEFYTCMASDMLTLKLKGFIQENKARLGKVTTNKLTMKMGSPALFGGWGTKPDKQPVLLTIELKEADPKAVAAAGKRTLMTVNIDPVGKPPSNEIFETRAMLIIENLKSYCMAD